MWSSAWLDVHVTLGDLQDMLLALPFWSVGGLQESANVLLVHQHAPGAHHAAAVPSLLLMGLFVTLQLVVFVFGPGSTQADASKLVDACRQMSSANIGMLATQPLQMATPASPTPTCSPACSSEGTAAFQAAKPSAAEQPPLEQEHRQKVAAVAALTPRQAFFADNEAVALQDAVGRVSAELLCPYPPGVPVVFPGECITAANVQQLQETLAGGGVVTGGQDSMLQTVLVVTKSN